MLIWGIFEAAAIPLAGLTASEAKQLARLGLEQRISVHGGAGGVGGYAIQRGKDAGCPVWQRRPAAWISNMSVLLEAEEVTDNGIQDLAAKFVIMMRCRLPSEKKFSTRSFLFRNGVVFRYR